MEFVARKPMGAAGKEATSESPEAWLGHVEDDSGGADAAGGDAAASVAERN